MVRETVISQDSDGRIWAKRTAKAEFRVLGAPVETIELVPLSGSTLITKFPSGGRHWPYTFMGDDGSGRAAFVHNGRANPRVG